jgi:hypothetical protein
MKTLILILAAILTTDLAQAQTQQPRHRPSGRTNAPQPSQPGRPGAEVPAQDFPQQDDAGRKKMARDRLTELLKTVRVEQRLVLHETPTTKQQLDENKKFDKVAEAYYALGGAEGEEEFIRAISRAVKEEDVTSPVLSQKNIEETFKKFQDLTLFEKLSEKLEDPTRLQVLRDNQSQILILILNRYTKALTEGAGSDYSTLRLVTQMILTGYLPEQNDMLNAVKELEGKLFGLRGPAKVRIGGEPEWKRDSKGGV